MNKIKALIAKFEASTNDLEDLTILKRIATEVASEIELATPAAVKEWEAQDSPKAYYGCKFTKNAVKATYTYSTELSAKIKDVDKLKVEERKEGVASVTFGTVKCPFKIAIADATYYDSKDA